MNGGPGMAYPARILGVAGALLAGTWVAGAGAAASPLPLLPIPALVREAPGSFSLKGASVGGDAAAAARFTDLLKRGGGPKLPASPRGTIRFVADPAIAGKEAYRLDVTPRGVTVAAGTPAGLFYGAETLWQLVASAKGGRITAVHIEDRPALAWRGLMLDSVRHFQPIAFIEQTLDRMAEAKLNVFQWHLTDDQGWRLPVDRYPRLISVGAWRTDAGTGARYGGFYTKAEIRHIVAYAAARHITVVPEVDLPGHATALIAAYPELASLPNPPVAPSPDWGVLPNIINTEPATIRFAENVLDEVMALFPGTYIHVGGDEAPKDQWKADPRAQARIKALGLKDENALQGWFTAQIGAYLEKHGRKLVGWDEILEGDVPKSATVMSWRGSDGAIKAAREGHDTVLSPMPTLYLDYRQSDAPDETPGRGVQATWPGVYAFAPVPAELTPEQRKHVLGLQANAFTEHAPTLSYVERYAWPRAAELGELGWSPAVARDWTGFAPRLVAALDRWRRLGWAYDEVPLAPRMRIEPQGVTLTQAATIGTLRYTLDGHTPTATSPAYVAPIAHALPYRLTAQAFLDRVPVGPARSWTIDRAAQLHRVAADLALCSNKVPLRLVDPVTHKIHWVDIMQACWRWPAAPTHGVMRVKAEVAQVPYNFSLGADLASVTFRKPETPLGELEIRQDTCDGPRIAVLPLKAGATMIEGRLAPMTPGPHDLCMTFTQTGPDPLHVLDAITLEPAP